VEDATTLSWSSAAVSEWVILHFWHLVQKLHIWNLVTVTWPNTKIAKIQDGGLPPFKIVFGHNAASDPPISVKFCIRK